MYMLNGWWFLSSGGSYPPVFTVVLTMSSLIGTTLATRRTQHIETLHYYV